MQWIECTFRYESEIGEAVWYDRQIAGWLNEIHAVDCHIIALGKGFVVVVAKSDGGEDKV